MNIVHILFSSQGVDELRRPGRAISRSTRCGSIAEIMLAAPGPRGPMDRTICTATSLHGDQRPVPRFGSRGGSDAKTHDLDGCCACDCVVSRCRYGPASVPRRGT